MVPAAAVIPSHLVYIIFVAFTKYVDGLLRGFDLLHCNCTDDDSILYVYYIRMYIQCIKVLII